MAVGRPVDLLLVEFVHLRWDKPPVAMTDSPVWDSNPSSDGFKGTGPKREESALADGRTMFFLLP